jgi:DNA-binding NarL/FixJ family response regulator
MQFFKRRADLFNQLRERFYLKYINAKNVLPLELLCEIQKYTEGCILYIPNKEGNKACWGSISGSSEQLKSRNEEILERYLCGTPMEKIADEFCLSYESIKKIVYKRSYV